MNMEMETRVLSWFYVYHAHWLTVVMKEISYMTSSKACCLWAGLIAIALMFQHRFIRASILFFGTAIASVLTELLKVLFARNRPPLSGIYDSYSFPSGHALTSAVFFGLVAWILGRHYPAYRKTANVVAAALTFVVGCSRLYLGVHWPSDVLGSFVIGFVFLRSWLWLTDRQR